MALLLGVLAWVWRPLLHASDPIIVGDLFVPLRREALLAAFTGFWNPLLEYPNAETMDRAAFVAPFLLFGNPVDVQRGWLIVTIFGAGLAMYVAARRLGAGPVLAGLVALLYGANPWLAMRIQHLFLLQAYAVLPLVVALWWRPLGRRSVLAMVLLLSLGSTTPHGAAALWLASIAALTARPTWVAWRSVVVVAGWYTVVNLYWIVPVLAFMVRTELVPSRVTWEMLETFSRHADLAAVVRLEGYWWPLIEFPPTAWARVASIALPLAAGLAWLRPRREVLVLSLVAGGLAIMAVGTHVPWWIGAFTIDGPLAHRAGWLFRDPNKIVGALAAVLLLLAALVPDTRRRAAAATNGARAPRAARLAARLASPRLGAGLLLAAYAAFALPRVTAYTSEVYQAKTLPSTLEEVFDFVAERGGRAAWVPGYFGVSTFWNRDQPTPEVLSLSSPVPVLSYYGYDARASRAFLALDGALLGDVQADVSVMARRWHVRWLVHHRDVLPQRAQPPHAADVRVVPRSLALQRLALPTALTADPFTVYDLGPLPAPLRTAPSAALTQRPVAAALAASAVPDLEGLALVADDHPGLTHLVMLPGDAAHLAVAEGVVAVDLAAAAPHAAPTERWSSLDEGSWAWWPQLASRHGPAPAMAGSVVATERPGARLALRHFLRAGDYRLLVRGYEGPGSGVVDLELGEDRLDVRRIDLERAEVRMAWHDLGGFTAEHSADVAIALHNRHGNNVLGDLRFVPTDEFERASDRVAELEGLWLWPLPDACRAQADGEGLVGAHAVLDEPITVPRDMALPGGFAWRDVAYLELDLEVDGGEASLELWTNADGTWIGLDQAHLWWQGRRTLRVPIDPSLFVPAPRGAAAPATLLRLLTAPSESAARIVVHAVRLVTTPPCATSVTAEAAGTLSLTVPGSAEEVVASITVGDRPPLITPQPAGVPVEAGEVVRIAFDQGVPREARVVVVRRSSPAVATAVLPDGGQAGEPERVSPGAEVAPGAGVCPGTWRLVRSDARYVEALRGSVDGEAVEVVSVDGLMAGAWLPPAVCGALVVHNPWQVLGRWTALVSSAGGLALVAVGLLGGVRRQR